MKMFNHSWGLVDSDLTECWRYPVQRFLCHEMSFSPSFTKSCSIWLKTIENWDIILAKHFYRKNVRVQYTLIKTWTETVGRTHLTEPMLGYLRDIFRFIHWHVVGVWCNGWLQRFSPRLCQGPGPTLGKGTGGPGPPQKKRRRKRHGERRHGLRTLTILQPFQPFES